jgi:hypothetical protein
MNNPRLAFGVGTVLGFLLGAVVAGAVVWWLGFVTLWTGRAASVSPTPPVTRPGINVTPGGPVATQVPTQPSGTPNDIFLSLSEPYLQAQMLRYLPPDGPLQPDTRLIVDEGNQLILDGHVKVSVGPFTPIVPARVHIGVSARQGRLGLSLDRVEVGPIPVPQNLLPGTVQQTLPRLEETLNATLLDSEALRDMQVVVVRTEQSRLILELDDGK